MLYGVIWKYSDAGGRVQKLISHPEALEGVDSVETAQNEGRRILADLQPYNKANLTPLSVVELNEEMIDALGHCPLVEIVGEDELMFVDVSNLDYWVTQGWWHK